ncbi:putative sugar transporter SWEET1 [Apostichopus japonicus]|uniref:Sugar transporter SWEET1 n=1 Tax=Stichopus japonicus TaxID=307972 RepID=A0A2G8L5I7_STIJA|nr:putative sugar transporter SWEET1 [Apostichopus japonicus]
MDHLYLLSWITVVFTVAMNLTGIPSCLEIYNSKTTQHVMFLPFVTMGINNCLWYTYGVFVTDWNLMISNLFGMALQILYIIIFLAFAHPKVLHLGQFCVAVVILAAIIMYFTTSRQPDELLIVQLAFVCISSTMVMYLSPLTELAAVFRTKNARKISMPLALASFSCSVLWMLYGIMVQDIFLAIPNIPGIISSIARFVLLGYYGRRRPGTEQMWV